MSASCAWSCDGVPRVRPENVAVSSRVPQLQAPDSPCAPILRGGKCRQPNISGFDVEGTMKKLIAACAIATLSGCAMPMNPNGAMSNAAMTDPVSQMQAQEADMMATQAQAQAS